MLDKTSDQRGRECPPGNCPLRNVEEISKGKCPEGYALEFSRTVEHSQCNSNANRRLADWDECHTPHSLHNASTDKFYSEEH